MCCGNTAIDSNDIPLPPLNEQKRIAAKLDRLLSKVNEAKERLDRIPTILKRFRQSVLHSAVSGKLTVDWREKHPDIEPAEVLLQRIQEERIKRYEEECAKAKAEGKRKPKVDNEPKRYFDYNTYSLPDSWQWTYLQNVSEFITDGDHNPPKAADRVSFGIPHLTAKNVVNQTLSEDGCSYITEKDFERISKRYYPKKNDVIITCVGSLGKTALVPDNYIFSADRNLAIVRPFESEVLPFFLLFTLNSSDSQQAIHKASGSTAQPHFYLADIRSFPIPLPPFEEQKEIVRRVQALFKKCDIIEERYLKAKAYTDKLTKSILAKAFRGELVPQDPNDEPAELLLERIRAEKVKTEPKRKTTASKDKK